MCKHEPDEIEIINGFPIRQFCREKEEQADIVGRALLLPRCALFSARKWHWSEEEICTEYCVGSNRPKMARREVSQIIIAN